MDDHAEIVRPGDPEADDRVRRCVERGPAVAEDRRRRGLADLDHRGRRLHEARVEHGQQVDARLLGAAAASRSAWLGSGRVTRRRAGTFARIKTWMFSVTRFDILPTFRASGSCEPVKNITVSLPDDVYRRARVKAAERDTSVSALVRDFLERLATDETDFERRKRLQNEVLGGIRGFRAGDRLGRDVVHERRALR